MKKKTIRLPLESLIYLSNEGCRQRCGYEHSQKYIERLTREYENRYKEQGGKEIWDGCYGGAIGEPTNSYEDGRWTSWTIEQVKKMLDKQGLPYVDGGEIEIIDVIF